MDMKTPDYLKYFEETDFEMYADFLRQTYDYAMRYSHDTHTKNAAMIIEDPFNVGRLRKDNDRGAVLFGTNKIPDGVCKHSHRLLRENKAPFMEHAERDVIFKAAKNGVRLKDSWMIAPWASCAECARAIAASGISTLVTHKSMMEQYNERWITSISNGIDIMREKGINLIMYVGKIGSTKGLFDGKEWEP